MIAVHGPREKLSFLLLILILILILIVSGIQIKIMITIKIKSTKRRKEEDRDSLKLDTQTPIAFWTVPANLAGQGKVTLFVRLSLPNDPSRLD